MQTRTTYDTSIKHLYRKGLEAALPRSFQTEIPRTNRHRWRTEPDDKYLGAEVNALASEQLALLQQFAEARTAQRIFRAYLRIVLTLRTLVLHIPEVQTALRKAKTRIVRVAEITRPIIGLKPILRLLDISSKTYHNWRDQVQNPCGTSIFHLCRKRHSNQASTTEIHRIKTMLENPIYQHWPIRSIAHFALRKKQVLLSPKT